MIFHFKKYVFASKKFQIVKIDDHEQAFFLQFFHSSKILIRSSKILIRSSKILRFILICIVFLQNIYIISKQN